MRRPAFRSIVRCPAALLATAWLAIASAAPESRPLPGGVVLRMTLPELQQAQPALKRIPRPARLAGGLVGSWSSPAIDVAGVALTPTYFFADGQVQRVEYLAREGSPATYSVLLAWARQAWGAELAAADAGGAYASWATGDTDAYLQLAGMPSGGQVRLVVRQRVLKDASEL